MDVAPVFARMRWTDVVASLDTGDIMLFRDPHDKGSRHIAAAVRDPYSHAALVVRTEAGVPFLWQATRRGVGIDPVETYVAQWPADQFGNVVVRHLQVERTPAMIHALQDFISEVYGRPLVDGTLHQLLHWGAGNAGIDLGEKKFFCAQLVAESLMRMGLLPLHPPANKYSERDYCQEHEDLDLLGGATLSDEVVIVLTPDEMAAAKKVALRRFVPTDKPDVAIGA